MKPARVQLSRKRGWRKPENTVVVARPTKWGNPYRLELDSEPSPAGETKAQLHERCRRRVVELFRAALVDGHLDITVDDVRRELRGKNLACWCPIGAACHADVLLEIANEEGRR